MNNHSGAKKLSSDGDNFSNLIFEVSDIVSSMSGIQLGEKQRSMVESRVRSRMIRLGIKETVEYVDFLNKNMESESRALLSLITTHHTYFFREFGHFEFLIKEGLSNIIAGAQARGEKVIRVWSAACSRGQEVYSLAMFLSHHLAKMAPGMTYEIIGSDVDYESVDIASNGVYPYKELAQVPAVYLADHWARGSGEISEFARAKKTIRQFCKFQVYNLSEPKGWNFKFDLIFCRNVFIYFNAESITKMTKNLLSHMQPYGYLCVGISETLKGLPVDCEYVGSSIYVHKSTKDVSAESKKVVTLSKIHKKFTESSEDKPIRILCVDDSPTILILLKDILSKKMGFEVIATASNGLEAIEVLKTVKVDAVILDIHMPLMDGLTYLEKNMRPDHPAVIMLSSVNRENASTALRAIELGASDYVEKPTMNNLLECGDEIRSKIKAALLIRGGAAASTLDKSFKKAFKITAPDKCLRVVLIPNVDRRKISHLLKNLSLQDPAICFIFEDSVATIDSLAKTMELDSGRNIQRSIGFLRPSEIYFFDFSVLTGNFGSWIRTKKVSILVSGVPTNKTTDFFTKQLGVHLVLEDLGPFMEGMQKGLAEIARCKTAITSYLSISEEYFG